MTFLESFLSELKAIQGIAPMTDTQRIPILKEWIGIKKQEANLVVTLLNHFQTEYRIGETIDVGSTSVFIPDKLAHEPQGKVRDLGDIEATAKTYAPAYPPIDLTDAELNKQILPTFDNASARTLFIYLRTLTHPYKQHILPEDRVYLDYLIGIEEWSPEVIMYLLSGTNAEKEYKPQSYENSAQNEELVEKIEKYLGDLEIAVAQNKESGADNVGVDLSEEKLSLKLKIKENWVHPNLPLYKYYDMVNKWGFMIHSIISPKYRIVNSESSESSNPSA